MYLSKNYGFEQKIEMQTREEEKTINDRNIQIDKVTGRRRRKSTIKKIETVNFPVLFSSERN